MRMTAMLKASLRQNCVILLHFDLNLYNDSLDKVEFDKSFTKLIRFVCLFVCLFV